MTKANITRNSDTKEKTRRDSPHRSVSLFHSRKINNKKPAIVAIDAMEFRIEFGSMKFTFSPANVSGLQLSPEVAFCYANITTRNPVPCAW